MKTQSLSILLPKRRYGQWYVNLFKFEASMSYSCSCLRKPNSDDEEIVEDGYPLKCPVIGCDDTFPAHPRARLKKAYEAYRTKYDLVYNKGMDAHEMQLATARFGVCFAIEGMTKISDLRWEAVDNDWPLEIDFKALPSCVIDLSSKITTLFYNEIVLANSAAWKSFVRCLVDSKTSLAKFARLGDINKFGLVCEHIHAG